MNVNEAILKRVRERALADLKPWPDKLKELFEEGGLLTATAGSHSSEVQKVWNEEPPGVTVHFRGSDSHSAKDTYDALVAALQIRVDRLIEQAVEKLLDHPDAPPRVV